MALASPHEDASHVLPDGTAHVLPDDTSHVLPDDKLHEECGVFGVWNVPDAAAVTALGLHALQHRGQEATGIVTGALLLASVFLPTVFGPAVGRWLRRLSHS